MSLASFESDSSKRVASRIQTREYVLVRRGFAKDRAHLAASQFDGLDAAMKWLLANKDRTLEQISADFVRPMIRGKKVNQWLKQTGVKETQSSDQLPRPTSESQPYIVRKSQPQEGHHPAISPQSAKAPTSSRASQGHSCAASAMRQKMRHTSRRQARGKTSESIQPQRQHTQLPGPVFPCLQTEQKLSSQSAKVTGLVGNVKQGQVNLTLAPGWMNNPYCCNPPFHFDPNEDTSHQHPHPRLTQLELDIAMGGMIARTMASRKDAVRNFGRKDSTYAALGNDDSPPKYEEIDRTLFQDNGASSNLLGRSLQRRELSITDETLRPTFLGQVYIGVSRNCGSPVYGSIVRRVVVFRRAIWRQSGWNLFEIEVDFFDISPRVLEYFDIQYGGVRDQSMYHYIRERM